METKENFIQLELFEDKVIEESLHLKYLLVVYINYKDDMMYFEAYFPKGCMYGNSSLYLEEMTYDEMFKVDCDLSYKILGIKKFDKIYIREIDGEYTPGERP